MKQSIIIISIVIILLSAAALWYYSIPRQEKIEKVYNVPKTSDTTQENRQHLDKTNATPNDMQSSDDSADSVDTATTNKNSQENLIEETDTEQQNNNNYATPQQEDGEHSQSSEETEFAALLKEVFLGQQQTAALLEEANKTQYRVIMDIVEMLNGLSIDEQREFFAQVKSHLSESGLIDKVFSEIISNSPDLDHKTVSELGWQLFLDNLVKHGYTLPEGLE